MPRRQNPFVPSKPYLKTPGVAGSAPMPNPPSSRDTPSPSDAYIPTGTGPLNQLPQPTQSHIPKTPSRQAGRSEGTAAKRGRNSWDASGQSQSTHSRLASVSPPSQRSAASEASGPKTAGEQSGYTALPLSADPVGVGQSETTSSLAAGGFVGRIVRRELPNSAAHDDGNKRDRQPSRQTALCQGREHGFISPWVRTTGRNAPDYVMAGGTARRKN